MRPSASALALAAIAVAACRTAPPPAVLPASWPSLVAPVPSFAALYRLDCCGLRGLLATVRFGDGLLRLTVAAPPAGTVADAWLTTDDGWVTRNGGRCVAPIGSRGVPLGDGDWLPLEPAELGVLLSGRVVAGARPVAAAPAWLELEVPPDAWIRWKVGGPEPAVTAVEVGRGGEPARLRADLSEHHGRIPGRIRIVAGRDRAELVLVEWQPAPPPEHPSWLAAPPCPEAP